MEEVLITIPLKPEHEKLSALQQTAFDRDKRVQNHQGVLLIPLKLHPVKFNPASFPNLIKVPACVRLKAPTSLMAKEIFMLERRS